MSISRFIDNFLPHNAKDFVAVYDQNFNQVFPKARPVKATIREISRPMEHPVESGAIITDHRIILPIEIELSMVIQAADYKDTYRLIKQFYLNGTLLIVQTKTGVYTNQLIASIPHEESPDQYNAIALALSLKQVQFVTQITGVAPLNPTNSSTVNRGLQNPGNAPPAQVQAAAPAMVRSNPVQNPFFPFKGG